MSPQRPLLVLSLLMLVSPAAMAEEADALRRARELQEQGDARYRSGDFVGALESYKESYKQAPRPLRLLGMAQCYRQLKQWEQAVAHYRAYLEAWRRNSPASEPPYLEEVRDHIARLEPLAEKARRQREAASRPASVPVRAEAPAPERVQPPPSSSPDDGLRRRKTTLAWVGLGASLAFAATAGILYGVGLSQRSGADERYMALGPGVGIDEFDRRWGDVESAQAKITAGHVMAALAAGALAFSIYELLSRPKAVSPERGARLVPGPLTISLQGCF